MAIPSAPTFADLIGDAVASLTDAGVDTARLDAEVLLGHAAEMDRSGVLARLRDRCPAPLQSRFTELVARRRRREPLAYIVGEKEFFSLSFAVTPEVLIPRPETELLVEAVLRLAPRGGRVLDVGTGSGCIAIAIAANRKDLAVDACEVSPAALALAAQNAARHAVDVRWIEADLFACSDESYDVVVSNPPYVAAIARLAPELAHEPRGALFAGEAGLDVIDRLLPEAFARLNAGGHTIVEFGSDQEAAVRGSADRAGYVGVEIVQDLAGHPRMLIARRP